MDQHNDFLHSESDNNGSIDILNGDTNEKRIRNKKKFRTNGKEIQIKYYV